jgi:rare lipoprotein A
MALPCATMSAWLIRATLLLLLGLAPAGAHPHSSAPRAPDEGTIFTETGRASWYGGWHDGKITANGSAFDRADFTAAHRSLKFGTIVRVVNLANRRTVRVEITDRGPHVKGRIIDVSAAAARELGMQHRGTARVRVSVLPEDQFPD